MIYPKFLFWIVVFLFSFVQFTFSFTNLLNQNYYPLTPRVKYDPIRDVYLIYTSTDHPFRQVPVLLTPEEYTQFRMKQYRQNYFRQQNRITSGMDYRIHPSPHELISPERRKKVPDKGSFRFRVKGTAGFSLGVKQQRIRNPSLPVNRQKNLFLDFDETIQLDLKAEVGSKLHLDMKYNTVQDFNTPPEKKIKLTYTGDEDEIIRTIEAGEVNLLSRNSLIRNRNGLFGIRGELQFGKLSFNMLVAQQQTASRRIHSGGEGRKEYFEITADKYDENQHFFLSHAFREQYDQALSRLPYVASGIRITRIEVWITNKERRQEHTRNVLAFSELGESPGLYELLTTTYQQARNIQQATQTLSCCFVPGEEYEKIESARLLDPAEYVLNEKIGYISLNGPLQPDEVLAVAFEYNDRGEVRQIGEFSMDQTGERLSDCLYVKLLRSPSFTPAVPAWKLMMKNVYSLPAFRIEKESFQLDVLFRNDSTGIASPYLPGKEKNRKKLLQMMGADRLDRNHTERPDGLYDFVEGYTVLPGQGKIVFPIAEPFAPFFKELYDSTLVSARQQTEKNKFILRGEYQGVSGAEISLGIINIVPGSVQVTSGGVQLTEQIDYTINYMAGTLTLLNQNIIRSGNGIEVTVDGQSLFADQRKTLAGLEMNYQVTDNLLIGGTLLHLSEKSGHYTPRVGEEGVKNTLWGGHIHYQVNDTSFVKRINKAGYFDWQKPLSFTAKGELGKLIAGRAINKEYGDYVYLDDFETSKGIYDLSDPRLWSLASTPWQEKQALFPESALLNDVRYGNNRSLLAWYIIDGMFTRPKSSAMPSYLKKDKDLLSNHYSRGVLINELFPAKELSSGEYNQIPVLNLAFYPDERGPYNLDTEGIGKDGKLLNPHQRWGGMMRKLDWNDFDAGNVQYIEFWLLDPFLYNRETATGGDLYINMGDISEDILKDGRKFFENGLPVDGNSSFSETTAWGKVPKQQSMLYAFENSPEVRRLQDTGLNGLSSEEEKEFPTYKEYQDRLIKKVSAETYQKWETDILSTLHDPAGDNFIHFRDLEYDRREAPVLTRYKRINGTEGNDLFFKGIPDTEDVNMDNNLNETERYVEYKISLRPADLSTGTNFITDSRTTTVTLENGTQEEVTWYQFKVPVNQFSGKVGTLADLTSIRFMRIYLTGWNEPVVLRLASLGLVRGEWRIFEEPEVEISVVSLEENGDRTPVNYVLPPGIKRVKDHANSGFVRRNEQALSLKIRDLPPEEVATIYKESSHDLRFYEQLQLFVHTEAFPDNQTGLKDDELSLFLRIGSDLRNNYYEYEIPLKITPPGSYNSFSETDREIVWPKENQLDISLSLFTELKKQRDRLLQEKSGIVSARIPYQETDPENIRNRVAICGNPSLANIRTLMIGVKNRSGEYKEAEVWINELRLTGNKDKGGWAVKGHFHTELSDLGSFSITGRMESPGFGDLDQSVHERRKEDYREYNITTSLQVGKLFPSSFCLNLPLFYSYNQEFSTPVYNPFSSDLLLSESDSVYPVANSKTTTRSLVINDMQLAIRSKQPRLYDPANFRFGYSYTETHHRDPAIVYQNTKAYRISMLYEYVPPVRVWDIFKMKLYYFPSQLSFSSLLHRHYTEIANRSFYLLMKEAPAADSFQQSFLWDRSFLLKWKLSDHLQFSFLSGTDARIEEPHVQVNKKLNPEAFRLWKDSVRRSILHLGQPLRYAQDFSVIYNFPFSSIPAMNWIHGNLGYQARYNWENRGQSVVSGTGHFISNQRIIKYQGFFNFHSLYGKNRKLRKSRSPLLMLKRINVSYERIDGTGLPGFLPETGDLLGQKRINGRWVPGIGYAFGKVKREYIEKAYERGWLKKDEIDRQTATIHYSRKWTFQTVMEPIPYLRLELSSDRIISKNNRIEYLNDHISDRKGGRFTASVVAVSSFFRKAANMNKLRQNRTLIASRIKEEVQDRSAEVLIPSFLAAYHGKDPGKVSLSLLSTPFPFLPNWRIMYDGLSKYALFNNHFSTLSLIHQYRGVYHIPSYISYAPSSPYHIPFVTLSDGFAPFIGIDATLRNHIVLNTHYNLSRHLNLSMVSSRLTENYTREYSIEIGYKTKELHKVIPALQRRKQPNELDVRIDLNYRKYFSISGNITDGHRQLIGGHTGKGIHFTASYSMNRLFTWKLYFDWDADIPILSETLYPTTIVGGGITLLLTLDYIK